MQAIANSNIIWIVSLKCFQAPLFVREFPFSPKYTHSHFEQHMPLVRIFYDSFMFLIACDLNEVPEELGKKRILLAQKKL